MPFPCKSISQSLVGFTYATATMLQSCRLSTRLCEKRQRWQALGPTNAVLLIDEQWFF